MKYQLPTTPFIEQVIKPAERKANRDYAKGLLDIVGKKRAALKALLAPAPTKLKEDK